MNLTLIRREYRKDGVFGSLVDENNNQIAVTIEHSYQDEDGNWKPKVPEGIYTCQRGEHRLHSGPIETFEILNVPGHSGILLHPGNTEADSEGCVLLGEEEQGDMITRSRDAFNKFLALQSGLDQFQLTVKDVEHV